MSEGESGESHISEFPTTIKALVIYLCGMSGLCGTIFQPLSKNFRKLPRSVSYPCSPPFIGPQLELSRANFCLCWFVRNYNKEPEGILLGFISRTWSGFMNVFVLESKANDICMFVLRSSSASGWGHIHSSWSVRNRYGLEKEFSVFLRVECQVMGQRKYKFERLSVGMST